jgi:hypothetical protein
LKYAFVIFSGHMPPPLSHTWTFNLDPNIWNALVAYSSPVTHVCILRVQVNVRVTANVNTK